MACDMRFPAVISAVGSHVCDPQCTISSSDYREAHLIGYSVAAVSAIYYL